MTHRTGIYRFSHWEDCWVERIDIDTKIGRQVLKWEKVEDDVVPIDQRDEHIYRRRKAKQAMATVNSMLGVMKP